MLADQIEQLLNPIVPEKEFCILRRELRKRGYVSETGNAAKDHSFILDYGKGDLVLFIYKQNDFIPKGVKLSERDLWAIKSAPLSVDELETALLNDKLQLSPL